MGAFPGPSPTGEATSLLDPTFLGAANRRRDSAPSASQSRRLRLLGNRVWSPRLLFLNLTTGDNYNNYSIIYVRAPEFGVRGR